MSRFVPLMNRVRELRQRTAGLTQEELARRCNVTRQTIIALEAGKYLPSLELAFRLARALGAGVEEVFQWARNTSGRERLIVRRRSGDPCLDCEACRAGEDGIRRSESNKIRHQTHMTSAGATAAR